MFCGSSQFSQSGAHVCYWDSSVARRERCPGIINRKLPSRHNLVCTVYIMCALHHQAWFAMQRSNKAIFFSIVTATTKGKQEKTVHIVEKTKKPQTNHQLQNQQLHHNADLIQSAVSICQSHELKAGPSCTPITSAAASLRPDARSMSFCLCFLFNLTSNPMSNLSS